MERSHPPASGESSGDSQLRLILVDPYGTRYEASGVPRDMVVHDLIVVFAEMAGMAMPDTSLIDDLRGEASQAFVIDLDDSAAGPTRLNPDETLRELHIQDGAVLRISPKVAAGGIHPPELIAFISAAVTSGVVGNAAYELLKATLRRVRERWGQRGDRWLYRDEAVELARGCLCLKFDIDDPERLRLFAADPVVVKFNLDTLQSLRTLKQPGRLKAKYWRCTYSIQEEGLPPSITVLVGIPEATYQGPDRSIFFLLPN